MTTAEIQVPHVYTALAEILKSLSVEKGGTLPSTMGGKNYITAVDAAAETKRKFVANNLIFLPNETVYKHELLIHKDRVNIAIVVTGEYTIVSTVDGSSVTVSGTGDGLALGTAVASNIASTNALKNALLRTFLITEQSIEDAAKNGENSGASAPTATERKLDAVRATPTPEKAPTELADLKEQIRVWIGGDEARRQQVNKTQEELKAKGLTGSELQRATLKAVKES